MAKVLIVEDDRSLAAVVGRALTDGGHKVELSHDGADALERFKLSSYDLMILDWDLPFYSGFELCTQFRKDGGTTPILFLTAKSHIDNKEAGFDAGADDYLTKPFELRELRSRVQALLRRPALQTSNSFEVGNFKINESQRKLLRSGAEITLSPKEFDIVLTMMRQPGKVFSIDELLKTVWTADDEVGPDNVRTHVKNIRQKIDLPGEKSLIGTVYGVGYKVEP